MGDIVSGTIMMLVLCIFVFATAMSVYTFYKMQEPKGSDVPWTGKFFWWYGFFAVLSSISWVGVVAVKSMYHMVLA